MARAKAPGAAYAQYEKRQRLIQRTEAKLKKEGAPQTQLKIATQLWMPYEEPTKHGVQLTIFHAIRACDGDTRHEENHRLGDASAAQADASRGHERPAAAAGDGSARNEGQSAREKAQADEEAANAAWLREALG